MSDAPAAKKRASKRAAKKRAGRRGSRQSLTTGQTLEFSGNLTAQVEGKGFAFKGKVKKVILVLASTMMIAAALIAR